MPRSTLAAGTRAALVVLGAGAARAFARGDRAQVPGPPRLPGAKPFTLALEDTPRDAGTRNLAVVAMPAVVPGMR